MPLKLTPYEPTAELKARVSSFVDRITKEHREYKDPGVKPEDLRGLKKSAWREPAGRRGHGTSAR